jgi:hypothetical protein
MRHDSVHMFFSLFIGMLILVLFAGQQTAHAQVKVHVQATAKDPVGNQLIYFLRENLRASIGMELVVAENDAIVNLRLVTIDPDDAGHRTIYSIVWTIKQFDRKAHIYYTSAVGLCSSERARECALQLTAQTDSLVTDLQRLLRESPGSP